MRFISILASAFVKLATRPVDRGAEIPIYPSLAEGTSERWARGEVQAHLDALRP